MAERSEVETASAPISAVNTIGLAGQMVAALARVPFRGPLRGASNPAANLGTSVTREVIRSFMGYSMSLRVEEFRSIEQILDDLCRVVMPPVVEAFGVTTRTVEIGGVPGELYLPRGADPRGMILYLHGGGYIGTSPRMYAFFTARLCRESGCAVFVADYRLAPEFPFPAGVEDAASVLANLVSRGVPRERLFVAGDSGGGGIATRLVMAPPDNVHFEVPTGVILFSPEVDLLLDQPSVTANADRDILPWNIPTASYLAGTDPRDPRVSADLADLTGFPPTFVSWGGDEMFRDPIRGFVERLVDAGVAHEAHEAPNMFHVFPILMPWADASRKIYRGVSRFIEDRIADAPPLTAEVLERIHQDPDT